MSQKYFILLKDKINQTEFIYSTMPIYFDQASNSFDECCEFIKTKEENNGKIFSIDKYESSCDISQVLSTVKNGILWSNYITEKVLCYTVSLIPSNDTENIDKHITSLITNLMNVRIDTINEGIKFIHDRIDKIDKIDQFDKINKRLDDLQDLYESTNKRIYYS